MKKESFYIFLKRLLFFSLLCYGSFVSQAYADVYISVLAVNATDQVKDKEITAYLPKELKIEDILDTVGLKLDYDVNVGSYFVYGDITLQPKETRTIKVRVRDVWRVEQTQVEEIKSQIDNSFTTIQNTEFVKTGEIRKKSLEDRLNFILEQQSNVSDNVQKRIDQYRIYDKELQEIRNNAVSVNYWRSKPPEATAENTYRFVIQLKNPSDKETFVTKDKHYLPTEIKPEHVIDAQGFDIKYDVSKGQSYLYKEEELKPGEEKRYVIAFLDVWKIQQTDVENMKDRARKAYDLLKKSEYAESAQYLVDSIKENLTKIEDSQAQEKAIKEHISAYRSNLDYFEIAKNDAEALDELLQALRENLERSILRNVLRRIQSIKSVSDIAEAIIGTKPSINNAWKIITGIVIFVGIFTALHFAIWGKRSAEAKKKQQEQQQTKQT